MINLWNTGLETQDENAPKFPHPPPPTPTLVSFTQKDETMQNAKNPKKIVRLTFLRIQNLFVIVLT